MDIINNAKRESDLADSIVSRTHEVYNYDVNIQNYELMLLSLPQDEWPEHLVAYQGIDGHDAAFACPAEYIEELAQYQMRDQIQNLIKSEKMERAKAAAILSAVDAQLTGPNRAAAIEAAIARRETALGN